PPPQAPFRLASNIRQNNNLNVLNLPSFPKKHNPRKTDNLHKLYFSQNSSTPFPQLPHGVLLLLALSLPARRSKNVHSHNIRANRICRTSLSSRQLNQRTLYPFLAVLHFQLRDGQ